MNATQTHEVAVEVSLALDAVAEESAPQQALYLRQLSALVLQLSPLGMPTGYEIERACRDCIDLKALGTCPIGWACFHSGPDGG